MLNSGRVLENVKKTKKFCKTTKNKRVSYMHTGVWLLVQIICLLALDVLDKVPGKMSPQHLEPAHALLRYDQLEIWTRIEQIREVQINT